MRFLPFGLEEFSSLIANFKWKNRNTMLNEADFQCSQAKSSIDKAKQKIKSDVVTDAMMMFVRFELETEGNQTIARLGPSL